jgi:hypothetical protein
MPIVTKYESSETYNVIAGVDIAEGQLCGIADTNGKAYLADNDATQGAAATDKAVGYAVKAAKAGKMVALAPRCTVDGFSSLTVGGLCYLDATAGGITQTKPNTNGVVLQVVGTARTATEVLGNVGVPQKYQTAGNSTLTSY